MNHELHFKLDEKTMIQLKNVSKQLKIKTLSKTVVEIFNLFLPQLEKYQIEFQNRKSVYKLIADPKEKRLHVHVYLPEEMYRNLKDLHHYLNFYSMAQILREIIGIFLKGYKQNISMTLKKFRKNKQNWELTKAMRSGKEFIRHLSSISDNHSIIIKYDSHHLPYSINFL